MFYYLTIDVTVQNDIRVVNCMAQSSQSNMSYTTEKKSNQT